MDKIFEKAVDLYVACTRVYVKSTSDGFAYVDAACTEKIDGATLKDIFEKGMIIVDTNEYKPVFYAAAAKTGGAVTYVKADTTPTTAKLFTLKSGDYAAS